MSGDYCDNDYCYPGSHKGINTINLINYILENSNKVVLKALDLTFHFKLDFELLCKVVYTKTSLINLRYLCYYFYSGEVEYNRLAIPNVILTLY